MLPEYFNYWHGAPTGYSGVSLHFRKDRFPVRPEFKHPTFDMENRVVVARLDGGVVVTSIYVPNGGKDYAAKLKFLGEMSAYVDGVHASGAKLILCGDMNVARTDADVHPKERQAGAIGQRTRTSASSSSASVFASGPGRRVPPPRSRQRPPVHGVVAFPGAGCGRRTSEGGGSTTSSPARGSRPRRRRCTRTSARATTPRSSSTWT